MKSRLFLLASLSALLFVSFSYVSVAVCGCDAITIKNNGYCDEEVFIITNQATYGPFNMPVGSRVSISPSADECIEGFEINGCRIIIPDDCSHVGCTEICPGDCPLDVVRFLCPTSNSCCHWEIR